MRTTEDKILGVMIAELHFIDFYYSKNEEIGKAAKATEGQIAHLRRLLKKEKEK